MEILGQSAGENKQSLRSGGASCTVHSCSCNERQLDNILPLQCFDHEPLLGKERFYRPVMTPHNAGQYRHKDKLLAALQMIYPSKKNVLVFLVHFFDKKPTNKNNAPEHLCFMCSVSLM